MQHRVPSHLHATQGRFKSRNRAPSHLHATGGSHHTFIQQGPITPSRNRVPSTFLQQVPIPPSYNRVPSHLHATGSRLRLDLLYHLVSTYMHITLTTFHFSGYWLVGTEDATTKSSPAAESFTTPPPETAESFTADVPPPSKLTQYFTEKYDIEDLFSSSSSAS